MTKLIPDKVELALEYPDKLYIGTFERTARSDAHLDSKWDLAQPASYGRGGHTEVCSHALSLCAVAEILHYLAKTVSSVLRPDAAHRRHCGMGQQALIAPSTLPPGQGDARQKGSSDACHSRKTFYWLIAYRSIWNVSTSIAPKHDADVARLYRSFLVARRAASPVAWLNCWRGTLTSAKRRRSSGSVSKSASTNISTVASLA